MKLFSKKTALLVKLSCTKQTLHISRTSESWNFHLSLFRLLHKFIYILISHIYFDLFLQLDILNIRQRDTRYLQNLRRQRDTSHRPPLSQARWKRKGWPFPTSQAWPSCHFASPHPLLFTEGPRRKERGGGARRNGCRREGRRSATQGWPPARRVGEEGRRRLWGCAIRWWGSEAPAAGRRPPPRRGGPPPMERGADDEGRAGGVGVEALGHGAAYLQRLV